MKSEHSTSTLSSSSELEIENAATIELLGSGEKSAFDREAELNGITKILETLTDDEIAEMPDRNMPLRYFRAEKGDIEKAIAKLRATLQWRKEFDVDNIVHAFDTDSENDSNREQRAKFRKILEEETNGKIYVRGYNKDGRALMYMWSAIDNTNHFENGMIHLVYNIERTIACTAKKTEGKLEKICFVQNYRGFSFRRMPPLKTSKYFLYILQEHYPERLHRCYLCSPPFVFRTFWNVISPFIDPVTKAKVAFLSKSDKTWQEFQSTVDHKLDQDLHCAYDNDVLRPFDPKEYLNTPFDLAFDESA